MAKRKRIYPYHPMQGKTNLPDGVALYEANANILCALCGATILANTFFARAHLPNDRPRFPTPRCRTCRPFSVYNKAGYPVAVEVEYLYVEDFPE